MKERNNAETGMKSGTANKKITQQKKPKDRADQTGDGYANICTNASCRLRKAGCRGFEGCPGYKGK
jgi:hypothetical protein